MVHTWNGGMYFSTEGLAFSFRLSWNVQLSVFFSCIATSTASNQRTALKVELVWANLEKSNFKSVMDVELLKNGSVVFVYKVGYGSGRFIALARWLL